MNNTIKDIFDESDELYLKISINKDDLIPHIYKALELYQDYLKENKKRIDEQSYNSLKHLFGLIKYNKIVNIDEDLPLSDKIVLFLALEHYKEILKTDLILNENIMCRLSDQFNEVVEQEDKKKAKAAKPKLTEEQLIMLNHVQNKKIMLEAKINSYDRMMIYQNIDSWFVNTFSKEKNNTLTHKASIKYREQEINFIAKFGKQGEHIYRIREIKS